MKQLFIPLSFALIAACGPETEPAEEPRPEAPPETVEETPPPATSASYRCGDISVMAEFSGDDVTLTIDGKDFVLRQAVSASGAKYEDPENPDNVFWVKGEEAQLTLGGEETLQCELRSGDSPADGEAQQDTPYRALGQEPGWILTIDETGMTLEYDYGQKTLSVAAPETRETQTHVEYSGEADGETVAVRILDEYCTDAMSGRPYPDRVEVAVEGRILSGCGGDTRDLLTGGEWLVEDISGGGVIDMARTTVQFGEARISGSGGCNSYSGAYEITGEGISFGPIASTKRACAPALMDQEQRFFSALENTTHFAITDTGALRLTGDGQSITARQATTPSP